MTPPVLLVLISQNLEVRKLDKPWQSIGLADFFVGGQGLIAQCEDLGHSTAHVHVDAGKEILGGHGASCPDEFLAL